VLFTKWLTDQISTGHVKLKSSELIIIVIFDMQIE